MIAGHAGPAGDAYATLGGDGMPEWRLDLGLAAALISRLDQSLLVPQHTPRGARLTFPMMQAASVLKRLPRQAELVGLPARIERARASALAAGRSTSLDLQLGTLHADGFDVAAWSPESQDPRDAPVDPVMARLMEMHGVRRIRRTPSGIATCWRGAGRISSLGDASPYVRITGLPDAFPAFFSRPTTRTSTRRTAVRFGEGENTALYVQEYERFRLHLPKDLPETVSTALTGEPLRRLVDHPAFEGWTIGRTCGTVPGIELLPPR